MTYSLHNTTFIPTNEVEKMKEEITRLRSELAAENARGIRLVDAAIADQEEITRLRKIEAAARKMAALMGKVDTWWAWDELKKVLQ